MPRKFLHVVNGDGGYEQHPVTKINIALSKSAGQKTFHITCHFPGGFTETKGIHPAVLEHIDNLLKFVGPDDVTQGNPPPWASPPSRSAEETRMPMPLPKKDGHGSGRW